jgi:carbonic anhydrase
MLVNSTLPDPLVYFAYEGSLTIPTCAETVNWYVIEKALSISKEQLDMFTKLWAGDQSFAAGKGNNREVKERNNRSLKKGGVQCEEQFIYFFSFVL